MDEFLEEGLGRGESVGEVFYFSHEEGVKTVDGFEFKVIVVLLLDGSFKIVSDESVNIFKFPEELEYTFMTDFSNGYLDTSQIQHHLAQ